MRRRTRSSCGFTIVEMLVVVAVIAALAGILLPALAAAKTRSKKAMEQNDIRQVGVGWNLYANNYDDAAVPGYVVPEVQMRWNVSYDYPVAVNGNADIPPEIASTWVWRLNTYIGDTHDTLHRYKQETDPHMMAVVSGEPAEFAATPGFGYNAFYVGGWWDAVDQVQMPNGGPSVTVTRPRFFEDGSGQTLNVMRRTIGAIRRSSEVVVFASSGTLGLGGNNGLYKEIDPFTEGSFYVTPARLSTIDMWDQSNAGGGADPKSLQAKVDGAGYPVGRFNGQIVVIRADGSVDMQYPGGLREPTNWIDAADSKGYQHTGEVPAFPPDFP